MGGGIPAKIPPEIRGAELDLDSTGAGCHKVRDVLSPPVPARVAEIKRLVVSPYLVQFVANAPNKAHPVIVGKVPEGVEEKVETGFRFGVGYVDEG